MRSCLRIRKWPNPVLLKPIEDGPLQVRVWNPKLYPSDRLHKMPIITPAYPAMCATHNVTHSTEIIVKQEFQRASDIVDHIVVGKAAWSELFTKHDFFHRYRYYLQVVASTGDPELQRKWAGTVESRIRQLVMKLEYVETLTIAHPFIKGFDQTHYLLADDEVPIVAQGEATSAITARTLDDIIGQTGGTIVYSTTFYIGIAIESKPPGSHGPRNLDISFPITDFVKLVKLWEHYNEHTMGICVRHIKRVQLPGYVFDSDDRPSRQLKRPQNGKDNELFGDEFMHMPNKKRRSSLNSSTSGFQSPAQSDISSILSPHPLQVRTQPVTLSSSDSSPTPAPPGPSFDPTSLAASINGMH